MLLGVIGSPGGMAYSLRGLQLSKYGIFSPKIRDLRYLFLGLYLVLGNSIV